MKFLAVYPTDYPKGTEGKISYTNLPNPTITISKIDLSTFGNQMDIMYSSNLFNNKNAVGCPQTVPSKLIFEHLLSQVVVAVKPTVTKVITITEVSLTNVYLKGDIAVTHNGDDMSYTYPTDISPILSYPLVAALENTAITNTDSYTQVSANGALVMPSDLNTRKLRIKYTINEGAEITHDIAIEQSWVKGKKYIYDVTINLNEITFEAQVIDWTSGSSVEPSI